MASVLQAALSWIERGASPIPVPYRSKRPILQGWEALRIGAEQATQFFNGERQNIGVLWGAASRGLVDVDLDSAAAVELATHLLPPTASYGRPSAPRSHRVYRCPDVLTRKWASPEKGMLLELRSDGTQSLVPPSRHDQDDEAYAWSEGAQSPRSIEPKLLLRRCGLVAAGCVLADVWTPGARHQLTLAVSGAMLAAGWAEGDVIDLVVALDLLGADRPEVADRARAVKTTLRKLQAREQVAGLPTLATLVGEPLVALLKRSHWLSLGAAIPPAGAARATAGEDDDVDLEGFMNIEEKPISWLWPNRIPVGKLSMVAGMQGSGKSVLSCELAARISADGQWPVDGTPIEHGGVLLLNLEDDPADTVRPRLRAAGADLSRIDNVKGVRGADGKQRLMTLEDAGALDRLLTRQPGRYKLAVVDPLGAVLGRIDSWSDSEVRALLAPLKDIAERHGLAVLLIAHLNKATSMRALFRVTGSVGFTAAVRSLYVVAEDPADPTVRLFLPEKSNCAPVGMAGLAYRLVSADLGNGITAARVEWIGVDQRSATDVMMPGAPQEAQQNDLARDWLRDELAAGPVPVRVIKQAATEEFDGSWSTVKRAARVLGVVGEGEPEARLWRLPDAGG